MTDQKTYSAAAEVAQVITRRTRWERMKISLKKAPLTAWFGMIVIAIYLFVAVFAQIIAPHSEAEIFTQPGLPWLSDGHFFGTDHIGRDVFSRLLYGGQNTMGIALATTFLSFIIGGGLGLTATISGGWTDQLLSRAVDVLMAIPSLIFALMLLSVFGSSAWTLIIIIAVLDSTRVFRITRSVAVNVVVMDYVEAARLRGEGLGWVMRREILPNILPPLVAEFGLRFCFVFLTIASLSFLGVGLQPPTADWGAMVKEGASTFSQTMNIRQYGPLGWDLMTPALNSLLAASCIALLTIAVNYVVDWFLHMTSGLKD